MCAALLAGAPGVARADVTFLLGEPYGRIAKVSPTGHAAVYFSRICADGPTRVRRCQPGELGAVVSRYNRVGETDWLAIPLLPFLYAVESVTEVPSYANSAAVARLRDDYRRKRLLELIPDADRGTAPRGNWFQLAGAAYDRQLLGFTVVTTASQDADMIRWLNARPKEPAFNFFLNNCADFVREILNAYFPKSIPTSAIADLGLTTPKHLAKSVVRLGEQRPELQLRVTAIEQIPGSRPASGKARGVLEGLVKTKKYAIPLVVVQPWVPVGMAMGYVMKGRFDAHGHVTSTYRAGQIEEWSSHVESRQ